MECEARDSGSIPATGVPDSSSQPGLTQTVPETQNASVANEKQPEPAKKKRKAVESRAKCWDHFDKMKDEAGGPTTKCKYCGKIFCADSKKKNGTSSLKNHVLNCKKMPHSLDSRQSLLTLSPASGACQSQVGVIGTWNFDQEAIRKALEHMLIVDELPFKFVEGDGFKNLMATCCPRFKIPSRWTCSRDCYSMFLDERVKLKEFIHSHSNRISITTDSWTSIQRINYMCVTAHFIDNEWKLQK